MDSYSRLLLHHTKRRLGRKIEGRVPVERVVCQCGKPVSVNILERHQTTGIHNRLMQLKEKQK